MSERHSPAALIAPHGSPNWEKAQLVIEHKLSLMQVEEFDPRNWRQTGCLDLVSEADPDGFFRLPRVIQQLEEDLIAFVGFVNQANRHEPGFLTLVEDSRGKTYVLRGLSSRSSGTLHNGGADEQLQILNRLIEAGAISAAGFELNP